MSTTFQHLAIHFVSSSNGGLIMSVEERFIANNVLFVENFKTRMTILMHLTKLGCRDALNALHATLNLNLLFKQHFDRKQYLSTLTTKKNQKY